MKYLGYLLIALPALTVFVGGALIVATKWGAWMLLSPIGVAAVVWGCVWSGVYLIDRSYRKR